MGFPDRGRAGDRGVVLPSAMAPLEKRLRQVVQAVCRAVSETVRQDPEDRRAVVNQRAEALLKTHGPGFCACLFLSAQYG